MKNHPELKVSHFTKHRSIRRVSGHETTNLSGKDNPPKGETINPNNCISQLFSDSFLSGITVAWAQTCPINQSQIHSSAIVYLRPKAH